MKYDGTHFASLEDAVDTMVQLDCAMVLEYKLTFVNANEGYWIVKRKMMSNFPMGSAVWVAL
jgi:hypothetical protein